jgi:molecular chaperone DnaK
VKEADRNRDEDRKKREEVEARNGLDHAVFTTERTLNENRARLDPAVAREVEDALAESKKALEAADVESMKRALQKLTAASHRMAEALYRKTDEGGAPPSEQKPEEDIVDADFTEVH